MGSRAWMPVVVSACLLVVPSVARAATTIANFPSQIIVTAAAGEANRITAATTDGAHFTISDAGAALTPGTGCTAIDPHSVTCTKAGDNDIPGLSIQAGDGDDSISLEGVDTDACVDAEVGAGTGDDTITTATRSGCFGGGFGVYAGEGDDLVIVTRHQYSVWGGPGDDVLIGGEQGDNLHGGEGDDVIDGGPGLDQMDGAEGRDVVDYSSHTGDVLVDLTSHLFNAGEPGEHDSLANFEDAVGGEGDDILIGTPEANTLDGGPGDDLLDGGAGADTLIGGDGGDVADYADRNDALVVRLDGQPTSGAAADGPPGARDTVGADVEAVWGGSAGDQLTGNASDNLLNGGFGADVLRGGAGEDVADYSERSEGVTVGFDGAATSGSASDGPPGARDTVATDMEDVFGGDGNDTLNGSPVPNRLDAGGGNDTVSSRDGVRDVVDCGPGSDLARVDALDAVMGCESASLPVPSPPVVVPRVPQPAPLTFTLTVASKPRLARTLSHGLAVSVRCSRACRLDGRLRLDGRSARRLGLTRGSRAVQVAAGQAGASGQLVLRFTKAARHALGRARSVKLTLTVHAVNADGTSAQADRTVTLRR
jgi:Ca2+-binding RTX toxin-like protein